jgi:hypothetical protein
MHSKPTTSWLIRIRNTLDVRTSHEQPWTHLTHHGPNSKEATTFPHIIFSTLLHRAHAQMALCLGTPKVESWNCPVFRLPGLWAFITSHSNLRLGWGLKRTCSSLWELSNGVSHSTCTHRDRVDSRLLVARNQTASLTSGPSFNYNLCWKCLNGSCEAISDIYTSRPFQRCKEHLDVRCFDPCNHVLSFQES